MRYTGMLDSAGYDALIRESAGAERIYSQRAQEFLKAMTGDGGTDHAALTGGAALRRESIEASLIIATQTQKNLTANRKFPTTRATALVDEFTRKNRIGGVLGQIANAELAVIPEVSSDYERVTAKAKHLMERRRVALMAEEQSANGLASAVAEETNSGTLNVLSNLEYLTWYGRSDCCSVEFDGYVRQLEVLGGQNVIDLRGGTLSPNAQEFLNAASVIAQKGRWGMATDYFCSLDAQNDIDTLLAPGHRMNLGDGANKLTLGAPVNGINSNMGNIAANPTPFIFETEMPFAAQDADHLALISGSGVVAPASVAGVAATNASSLFTAAHAGGYYYAVEAKGLNQLTSTIVKSGLVTVAAGESVTVTITPGVASTALYFDIFRSRRNGTNGNSDFRFVTRIPANGTSAVTYVDHDQNIPGTSVIPVCSIMDNQIGYRRFLDLRRFPLYPTNTAEYVWAQVWSGYLRITTPVRMVLIKNVLPTRAKAVWDPYN